MAKVLKRSEVKKEDTWDLEDLFKDKSEVEKAFKFVLDQSEILSGFEGKLFKKENLLEYFKISEKAYRMVYDLIVYANNKKNEDIGDSSSNALCGKVISVNTKLQELTSFASPEIIANFDKIKNYTELPEFKEYKRSLFLILRQKEHTLSKEQEKILSSLSELEGSYSDAFSALTDVDIDFGTILVDGKEEKLTLSSARTFGISQNREVRKQASQGIRKGFESHLNTLAQLLKSNIKSSIINSRLRNFPNVLQSFLFEKDIPEDVHLNLTKTVFENLAPLHKYYKIRKDYFNYDDGLKEYDSSNLIVKEFKKVVSYDEAVKMVIESLKPLGKDYTDILQKGLTTDRWVDKYENLGKESGAYSSSSYRKKPYIKMNYKEDDNLSSVFTLAHEAGHSMHSYLASKHNNFFDHDYTIFEAEIASTFNEHLLFDFIFKTETDKKVKIALIESRIQDFIGTFYRQTMFADFEYQIHKYQEDGNELTLDTFKKLYGNLVRHYYGPSMNIEGRLDYAGLRIPHFYSDFYVFQYATGIAASLALSQKVLNGGQKELDEYLGFLKNGGSKFPIDNLRQAGVDMKDPKPIQVTIEKFSEYVNEFEKLVKEL